MRTEAVTAVLMKIKVCLRCMPCHREIIYVFLGRVMPHLHFGFADEGTKLLWNISSYIPFNTILTSQEA
jgi:hypothetical protein